MRVPLTTYLFSAAILAALTPLAGSELTAQDAAFTSAPPIVRLPVPAGPRADALQAGVRAQAAVVAIAGATAESPTPQPELARKRGGPQMIIGGVALVGGAVVGGDVGTIVMLAGLGYGLYGLYLYLQ